MKDHLRRTRRNLGTALLGALLLPAVMSMHIHLKKSMPANGCELKTAPEEVRLWFTEPVSVSLTRIALMAPDSSRIDLGKVGETDDPASVASEVNGEMEPGTYTVQWRTASKDGHIVKGDYTFTLTPASSP